MPADPWIDLPDAMADDDLSLHAGMMKALQNNQARAYEQSGYDYFALRGAGTYARTIIAQEEEVWVWLDELDTLPCPVSYDRNGVWNPIRISFVSTRTGAGVMLARAYLLSSSGRPPLDPDDGVAGEQAYDEQSVALGSLQTLDFDPIYPRIADSRQGGDEKVPGLHIPLGWIRVALWAESAQSVSLAALRVQEIPDD
jgi:hypothetical protein